MDVLKHPMFLASKIEKVGREREIAEVQDSPSYENDNCGDDCREEDKAAKDAQGNDSSCKERG